MEKNVFDVITEYAVNEGLNDILLNDIEYQKIQREMDELMEKYDKLDLSKEQKLLIDRFIVSHTASGCCYGRIAYKQGIRDCALLLKEMELIK